MYNGMLHTHLLFISLYVLLYIIKVIILYGGDKAKLKKFRRKTKVLEMVFPLIFLGTGIFLAIKSPYASETWFIVKMVLIVLSVVLGVLTFIKKSKPLAIVVLLIFGYIIMISFNKNLTFQSETKRLSMSAQKSEALIDTSAASYTKEEQGALYYTKLGCAQCHGADGTAGLAAAANLQTSTISDDVVKDRIINGKKNMPAFGSYLNEEEISALTLYVKQLRK